MLHGSYSWKKVHLFSKQIYEKEILQRIQKKKGTSKQLQKRVVMMLPNSSSIFRYSKNFTIKLKFQN